MGSRQVAEDHLGAALCLRPQPDVIDVLGARGSLAAFVVGQQVIHEPLVKGELAAIVCYEQHIVHAGVHHLVPHTLGAAAEFGHHLLLMLGGFQNDIVIGRCGHRQL